MEEIVSFGRGVRWRQHWVMVVLATLVSSSAAVVLAASEAAATSAVPQALVRWGDLAVQQSVVPTRLSDVTAISAGPGDHALALKGDGTVLAWGAWREGQ